jgi:hypothetical protein
MGLFKMSQEKQIVAAISARDKITARLADAERAVTDHRQVAEALALDGASDDALDAAEAKTRASVDRAATLRAALAQSVIVVANLERERDEAADRKQREATSSEVEQLARRMTDACARLVADAAALADWTARAAAVVPEAGGVLNFCVIVGNEIPAASSMISRLLRVHAQAVLDGRAAAVMPKAMEAYVAPPAPTNPPSQVLFCLRSVKWVDDAGQQRIAGKFEDAEVPVRLVGKALKCGACVPMTDPRRRELHGTQGGFPPRLDTATDLDVDPATQVSSEPILASSPFTVVDRGGPIQMKIAR